MNKGRKRIYDMTGGRCFYCGCELDPEDFHIDHFKAKEKGGKDSGNRVPSCQDCNLCKSNLDIEEFRDKIAGFMNDYHVRMISKYYDIKKKPIVFFFEKEAEQ